MGFTYSIWRMFRYRVQQSEFAFAVQFNIVSSPHSKTPEWSKHLLGPCHVGRHNKLCLFSKSFATTRIQQIKIRRISMKVQKLMICFSPKWNPHYCYLRGTPNLRNQLNSRWAAIVLVGTMLLKIIIKMAPKMLESS